MKTLEIDIETYSTINLSKSGVYRYADSPDFEILLFAYSVDGGDVKVVDLATGENLPDVIIDALTDSKVIKWAFNANFERICLSKYLGLPTGKYLDPTSFKCSMIWSAYMGLPLSLQGVGAVLGLEKQKLKAGKDLIRYFCTPCKPTIANGKRTRNNPAHDPTKWATFKEYNKRDVETELEIQMKLSKFPVPESIWQEYYLDQEINDRGVALDLTFIKHAIDIDEHSRAKLMNTMKALTNLDNPNSVQQLKKWLADNGLETESLGKKIVSELLEASSGALSEVLTLRQQLSKSSVKKYQTMEGAICSDKRARGMFQFYGANRTGRFSGRILQPQNLPRNEMSDLSEARELVRTNNLVALEMLYDSIPEALSELIRTSFIPKDGYKFIAVDFSSIERVVLAWLAREQWVLDAYARKEDLYIATASQMFNVPIDQINKKDPLRQKGKVADLACIAEGQLVLTDEGLVPIEGITLNHKLWDGEAFVKHDGVIYKGIKEVITYDGLTATKDHLVWTSGKMDPVQFGEVATNRLPLLKTGDGRQAIRMGEDNQFRKKMGQKSKPLQGFNPECCHSMTGRSLDNRRKARLYDILNAGPNNRYTVSNVLVHNCGYGGSVGALVAMGALDQGLAEHDLRPLVNAWRAANPNVVAFWWAVDRAAIKAVRERTTTQTHGIKFSYQSGMLFIKLPSGRSLSYVKPRIELNQFGSDCVTYEGISGTKKWERIQSYGPKFVENIVQALSRDILCYAMENLRQYPIVMHIHDEIVIEAKAETTVDSICNMMCQPPLWAKDLKLRAEGFESFFYKKE